MTGDLYSFTRPGWRGVACTGPAALLLAPHILAISRP